MRLVLKKSKKKSVNVNFKTTPEILKEAKEKAEEFTGGNLTKWFEYAATHCKPYKKDLEVDNANY